MSPTDRLPDRVDEYLRSLMEEYADDSPEWKWLQTLQREIAGRPSLKTHELKCVEPHFGDILSGRKRFELRLDDRAYQVGDRLHLYKWEENLAPYTWNHKRHLDQIECDVTCIVREYMLPGHVCMGIKVVSVMVHDDRMAYLEHQVRHLTEIVDGYAKDEPPIVKGALDAQAEAEYRLQHFQRQLENACNAAGVARSGTHLVEWIRRMKERP